MRHSLLAEMLGSYILERRNRLNMTQTTLAKNLKCSAQFLGKIEKGHVMMPEPMLAKTINLLDLDANRFRKIYRLSAEDDVDRLFGRGSKSHRRAN